MNQTVLNNVEGLRNRHQIDKQKRSNRLMLYRPKVAFPSEIRFTV